MFSCGINFNQTIFRSNCCPRNNKLKGLIKNLSYRKINLSSPVVQPPNNSFNENKILLHFDKTLPKMVNARMIYLAKSNSSLNKWYTTTELNTQQTEKEMYDMICEMSTEQRNLFSKALALWESQEVKGQFEGINFFYPICKTDEKS